MAAKPTYWVRSKTNEASDFGRRPVPAKFTRLEDAKAYRRELNLHRGAYHPGYTVEEEKESTATFTVAGLRPAGNRGS